MKSLLLTMLAALAALQGVELKVVQRAEPEYPALARAARVEQNVRLALSVNPDGSVKDVRILEGHPLLNEAAISAARKTKFNATPFGGTFELTIPFAIPKPTTGQITGRVVDSEGQPMPGVRISPRWIAYSGGRIGWNQNLAVATTDANGAYSITADAPNDVYVLASINADNVSPQTYYPGTPDPLAAVTVAVRAGSTSVADIRVPKIGTVRVSGKILIPTLEQPARGSLDIRLLRIDPRFLDETVARQISKVENTNEVPFELRGVPPGVYQLTATIPTGPPNWAYSARVSIDASQRSVEGVALALRRNLEFKGRVTFANSTGKLEGLLIGLMARGGNSGAFFPVGADGTVRLLNLPEDDYYVIIRGNLGSAYVSDLRHGATGIYNDGNLTIGRGPMDDLQVVLATDGGTVTGTVQTALKEPVKGVHVLLVPDAPRRQNTLLYKDVITNDNGSFGFYAVAPGGYKIFAFENAPGGAIENAEFIARYEQRGSAVTVRGGSTIPAVILSAIPKP